jgi:LAO/AO transport system kinase
LNYTRLNIRQYHEGILAGDRILLAKAITLIESTLPEDQRMASELLDSLLPHTGNALRIGITGVPGVGKSSFIEVFGAHVTNAGKKIAVLTVDPSSQVTKGSILGDKTRMQDLSKNPNAFIRPSATASVLGGVAAKTREAMLLCEAAGFDVIIIETVGVGQSEVAVRNMVDFFLLLMLAGAGDELQGIKKGIVEMADALVVTKADGDNINRAKEAQSEYQHALHLLPASRSGWTPQVLMCSAMEQNGITEIWKMILDFKTQTTHSGYFEKTRQAQNITWFQEYFEKLLKSDYLRFEHLRKTMTDLKDSVATANRSPQQAALEFLQAYHRAIQDNKS